VLVLSLPLPAQQPDAAAKQQKIQEKVAALKQSLAQNQAALKQYRWTESTEISLKGEVKKREQKEPLRPGWQGSEDTDCWGRPLGTILAC
jgi:hypothetical protein